MVTVEEVSPGIYHAAMRYTYGGDGGHKVWTQSFSSKRLTADEVAANLVTVGLRPDGSTREFWCRRRTSLGIGL
jgi:hypothetical protein